jgi:hypothetical protein
MAYLFAEHFKSYILTKPIDESETVLPSPWKMRKKIIIKNRKCKSKTTSVDSTSGVYDVNNLSLNDTDDNGDHDYDDKHFQGVLNLIGEDGSTFPKVY